VSLDLPGEAEQAERDGRSFLERHGTPLLVDEVQYAPGLFRHLKSVVDARRTESGLYVLTGSQKFPLMRAASESLAGRVQIVELETLAADEALSAGALALPELLWRGGFPELHARRELEPELFYRSYVATYLERDLRSVLNVTSLRDFERFLRACAVRSAHLLNKTDLGRDVGVSAVTANAWLGALEASNQVVLLEPWFTNRSKSITKSPKLYLADTGLLCFLLNLFSGDDVNRSPQLGQIWESFVFAELRKASIARGGIQPIQFFRDRGLEVDFLIQRGQRIVLMEAKWTEHPDPRQVQNLAKAEAYLGESYRCTKWVVCQVPHRFPVDAGVQAVPVSDLGTVLADVW
jgi:predicted AAA+ superfamily ATPase